MQGIVLKRLGHNCTILEQEPSTTRPSHAAGIFCGPEVKAFLEKHDRALRIPMVEHDSVNLLGKNLKPWYKIKRRDSYYSWGLLWNILRANYDGYSSKACPFPPNAEKEDGCSDYMPGKQVTNVTHSGDKVTVEFKDVTDQSAGSIDADLVIAADGSSSPTRALLLPHVQRKYAGYVSWRGTVPESELTPATIAFIGPDTALYHMDRHYTVVYTIPTDDGIVEPGHRLVNWVWYYNYPEASPDLAAVMTDTDGKLHANTVPRGKVAPAAWARQRALAASTMPPPYVELVEKTRTPFVTKINDAASPSADFFGGRLLLVGDALAAFRPHVALSTNQAALHARLTEEMERGEIGADEWSSEALRYARVTGLASVAAGVFGLGSRMELVVCVVRLVLVILGQKLGLIA